MGKKTALLVLFSWYGLILCSQRIIFIRTGYNQSFLYEIGDNSYRYGPPEFDSRPAYYFGLTFYKNKSRIFHWEWWLDFTKKHFSMNYTSGGLGFWETCNYNYRSCYIDLSYYPVLELGSRLKVAVSIRPSLEILLDSYYEGEKISNIRGSTTPKTEQKSGNSGYFFLGLNVRFNLRFVYNINNHIGILLEGQYSQGITNNFLGSGIKLNFNNYSAGTGIALFL